MNRTPLYLYVIVTVSGAAVLALEILGTRILGPEYGVSLFLWSALITVTLAALSAGYLAGGAMADRTPSYRRLSSLLAAAGLWIVAVPWTRPAVVSIASGWDLRTSILASSVALFFAPLADEGDYSRSAWFDDTGLAWINPSPNIRSLTQATLYPGVALVEGANLSVGRGTDSPFEQFGAPWINRDELVRYLKGRSIKGISIEPAAFTPRSGIFSGRLCHGARLRVVDRNELDAAVLGIEIAGALYKLYPHVFKLDRTLGMIGSRSVLQMIKQGKNPAEISLSWQASLDEFKKTRAKYLLN